MEQDEEETGRGKVKGGAVKEFWKRGGGRGQGRVRRARRWRLDSWRVARN